MNTEEFTLPQPTEEELLRDAERPDNWDDFILMLDDMKKHVLEENGNIVENDEPIFLRFTYRCVNSEKTWSIKISNVRKSINELREMPDSYEPMANKIRAGLLERAIQTAEGKNNLLGAINAR